MEAGPMTGPRRLGVGGRKERNSSTTSKLRKSCDPCSLAKRRCDGRPQCSLCHKKGLRCVYGERQKSGPKGRKVGSPVEAQQQDGEVRRHHQHRPIGSQRPTMYPHPGRGSGSGGGDASGGGGGDGGGGYDDQDEAEGFDVRPLSSRGPRPGLAEAGVGRGGSGGRGGACSAGEPKMTNWTGHEGGGGGSGGDGGYYHLYESRRSTGLAAGEQYAFTDDRLHAYPSKYRRTAGAGWAAHQTQYGNGFAGSSGRGRGGRGRPISAMSEYPESHRPMADRPPDVAVERKAPTRDAKKSNDPPGGRERGVDNADRNSSLALKGQGQEWRAGDQRQVRAVSPSNVSRSDAHPSPGGGGAAPGAKNTARASPPPRGKPLDGGGGGWGDDHKPAAWEPTKPRVGLQARRSPPPREVTAEVGGDPDPSGEEGVDEEKRTAAAAGEMAADAKAAQRSTSPRLPPLSYHGRNGGGSGGGSGSDRNAEGREGAGAGGAPAEGKGCHRAETARASAKPNDGPQKGQPQQSGAKTEDPYAMFEGGDREDRWGRSGSGGVDGPSGKIGGRGGAIKVLPPPPRSPGYPPRQDPYDPTEDSAYHRHYPHPTAAHYHQAYAANLAERFRQGGRKARFGVAGMMSGGPAAAVAAAEAVAAQEGSHPSSSGGVDVGGSPPWEVSEPPPPRVAQWREQDYWGRGAGPSRVPLVYQRWGGAVMPLEQHHVRVPAVSKRHLLPWSLDRIEEMEAMGAGRAGEDDETWVRIAAAMSSSISEAKDLWAEHCEMMRYNAWVSGRRADGSGGSRMAVMPASTAVAAAAAAGGGPPLIPTPPPWAAGEHPAWRYRREVAAAAAGYPSGLRGAVGPPPEAGGYRTAATYSVAPRPPPAPSGRPASVVGRCAYCGEFWNTNSPAAVAAIHVGRWCCPACESGAQPGPMPLHWEDEEGYIATPRVGPGRLPYYSAEAAAASASATAAAAAAGELPFHAQGKRPVGDWPERRGRPLAIMRGHVGPSEPQPLAWCEEEADVRTGKSAAASRQDPGRRPRGSTSPSTVMGKEQSPPSAAGQAAGVGAAEPSAPERAASSSGSRNRCPPSSPPYRPPSPGRGGGSSNDRQRSPPQQQQRGQLQPSSPPPLAREVTRVVGEVDDDENAYNLDTRSSNAAGGGNVKRPASPVLCSSVGRDGSGGGRGVDASPVRSPSGEGGHHVADGEGRGASARDAATTPMEQMFTKPPGERGVPSIDPDPLEESGYTTDQAKTPTRDSQTIAWLREDDEKLLEAVEATRGEVAPQNSDRYWEDISAGFYSRTAAQCEARWNEIVHPALRERQATPIRSSETARVQSAAAAAGDSHREARAKAESEKGGGALARTRPASAAADHGDDETYPARGSSATPKRRPGGGAKRRRLEVDEEADRGTSPDPIRHPGSAAVPRSGGGGSGGRRPLPPLVGKRKGADEDNEASMAASDRARPRRGGPLAAWDQHQHHRQYHPHNHPHHPHQPYQQRYQPHQQRYGAAGDEGEVVWTGVPVTGGPEQQHSLALPVHPPPGAFARSTWVPHSTAAVAGPRRTFPHPWMAVGGGDRGSADPSDRLEDFSRSGYDQPPRDRERAQRLSPHSRGLVARADPAGGADSFVAGRWGQGYSQPEAVVEAAAEPYGWYDSGNSKARGPSGAAVSAGRGYVKQDEAPAVSRRDRAEETLPPRAPPPHQQQQRLQQQHERRQWQQQQEQEEHEEHQHGQQEQRRQRHPEQKQPSQPLQPQVADRDGGGDDGGGSISLGERRGSQAVPAAPSSAAPYSAHGGNGPSASGRGSGGGTAGASNCSPIRGSPKVSLMARFAEGARPRVVKVEQEGRADSSGEGGGASTSGGCGRDGDECEDHGNRRDRRPDLLDAEEDERGGGAAKSGSTGGQPTILPHVQRTVESNTGNDGGGGGGGGGERSFVRNKSAVDSLTDEGWNLHASRVAVRGGFSASAKAGKLSPSSGSKKQQKQQQQLQQIPSSADRISGTRSLCSASDAGNNVERVKTTADCSATASAPAVNPAPASGAAATDDGNEVGDEEVSDADEGGDANAIAAATERPACHRQRQRQ